MLEARTGIRKAVESYPKDTKVVILAPAVMSHHLNGARFGYLNSDFDRDFLDKIETDPMALTELTHQQIMEDAGVEAVGVDHVAHHARRA